MSDNVPPQPPEQPGGSPPASSQGGWAPPPPGGWAAGGGTSPWSGGWGAPIPAWSPPPGAPGPRRSAPSRPLVLVGAGMLALGLAAGALITQVFARDDGSKSPGTATVAVNSDPVTPGGGGGDAVKVAEQLGPAVGTIVNRGAGSSTLGGQTGNTSLGSGFVFSNANGFSYLLTNNHVVEGAKDLRVIMPGGKNLVATVVGTDKIDDLAVVSVHDGGLKQAVFGRSANLKVGQQVVAIGSPLGNEGSVTTGVVSALHRAITAGDGGSGSSEQLSDVLQTDASINPGNSGGPLADANGRVIGVNVAVAGRGTNIGFSIPSDIAAGVAQTIVGGQKVHHPFVGISFVTAIDATNGGEAFDGPGVLVKKVLDNSPASSAGIHPGDIIRSIDGTDIDNGQTVGGIVGRHRVGDTLKVTIKRGNQTSDVNLTLVERPDGV